MDTSTKHLGRIPHLNDPADHWKPTFCVYVAAETDPNSAYQTTYKYSLIVKAMDENEATILAFEFFAETMWEVTTRNSWRWCASNIWKAAQHLRDPNIPGPEPGDECIRLLRVEQIDD